MYPGLTDKHGIGVMDAGIFGALVGAGLGAAGSLLNRGAKQRQGQQQLDLDFQNKENQFNERTGGQKRFADQHTFKNRLLGNLGNSFTNTIIGAGEPGSAGSFSLQRLDPKTLFQNITAGKFGEDLRGTTQADIGAQNFKAPKFESGSSFLGDLFSGAAQGMGAMGGFGGGGGGNIPQSSGNWSLNSSPWGG